MSKGTNEPHPVPFFRPDTNEIKSVWFRGLGHREYAHLLKMARKINDAHLRSKNPWELPRVTIRE